MTNEEIIEGNKLISEFMGAKFHKATEDHDEDDEYIFADGIIDMFHHQWSVKRLQFNLLWDRLMPVVQKIESFKTAGVNTFVSITTRGVLIRTCSIDGVIIELNHHPENFGEWDLFKNVHQNNYDFLKGSKIEATWIAVVSFIKWYNQSANKK